MVFSPKQKLSVTPEVMVYENGIIERVTRLKFLGVHFEEDLKWTTRVKKFKTDISCSIRQLFALKMYYLRVLKKHYIIASFILVYGIVLLFGD